MHEFLDQFYPRFINVFHRDLGYLIEGQTIVSNQTRLLSFLYAYEGEGILELDEARFTLTAGCAFQIPLGRKLRLHNAKQADRSLRYYTVQYDYRFIEWEGTEAVFRDPAVKQLPFPYVVPMPDQEGMRASMHHLYQLWNSRKPGNIGKARVAFLRIVQQVYDQLHYEREEDPRQNAILESAAYIDRHYALPLDRDNLARRASMSNSYFSVLFKKYMGSSPVQYITHVRLSQAMHLLRETVLPVSEVAREVGFQDPLYFTRVFSRSIGLTPREYRNT